MVYKAYNGPGRFRVAAWFCGALTALAACLSARADGSGQGAAARIRTLGYQLDVSRCKVPTMATLRRMVDVLSALGYGQLQLYTEHTFAYRGHESVWAEASPMTPDEIRELDGWCVGKGIELVPNQNSFGHFERWLRHPEYVSFAEAPRAGVTNRWGGVSTFPMALSPTDPRVLPFLGGLYDQLLPCFRSRKFNVGCDEVTELSDQPASRSAAEVRRRGGAQWVYADFLNAIHGLVSARHHEMMYWADIVLHSPETIPSLPADAIALDWGYEANHPFEKETSALKAANRRFYVCPGTSAWCSLTGRVKNMTGNVDNAVAAGERNGADGLLLADWGDGGYPQPWIVSVPALVYAAARVRGEALDETRLAARIDALLGCRVGEALIAYGNLYLAVDRPLENQTVIWRLLMRGERYGRLPERREPDNGALSRPEAEAILAAWRAAQAKADFTHAPEWVREDFATMDLLLEAFEHRVRGRHAELMALVGPRYRELWLKQNRRGGLEESLVRNFSR